MKSILRKISKFILYGVIALLVLLIILYLLIQTPPFKNWARKNLEKRVNRITEQEFSIGKLEGNLLSNINFTEIILKTKEDTTIYISSLNTSYNALSLLNKKIEINSLIIDSSRVNLTRLDKIIENYSQKTESEQDTAKKSFSYDIQLKDLQVNNLNIKDIPQNKEYIPAKINDLNLLASLKYSKRTQNLHLKKFNLNTKRPEYNLERSSFQLSRDNGHTVLDDFIIETEQNQIAIQGRYFDTKREGKLKVSTTPIYIKEFKHLISNSGRDFHPELSFSADYRTDALEANFSAIEDEKQFTLYLKADKIDNFWRDSTNRNKISYTLENKIRNINIADLMQDSTLESIINGDITIQGQGINPKEITGQVKASFYDNELKEYKLSDLNLTGTYNKNIIQGNLFLKSNQGEVELDGKVKDIWDVPDYDFNMSLSNLNMDILSEENDYNSNINLDGSIQGRGFELNRGVKQKHLTAQVEADLYNSKFEEHEIPNFNFTGVWDKNQLQSEISIEEKFGRVKINGDVREIWDQPNYNLDILVSNFNIDTLSDQYKYDSNINLTGSVKGSGLSRENLKGKAQFNASPSSIDKIKIDTLFSNFHMQGKQYNIDTFYVQSSAAELGGSGDINQEKGSDLQFLLSLKDLTHIEEYIPLDSLKAAGDVAARVKGKPDSLKTSAKLRLKDLYYQDNSVSSLNSDLSFLYNKKIKTGELDLDLSKITVGDYNLESLQLKSNYIKDTASIELGVIQGENDLSIESEVMFDTIPRIDISDIAINIGDQKWEDGAGDTEIIIDKGTYNIDNFLLVNQSSDPSQSISAQGLLSRKGEENFTLNLSNIDTELLKNITTRPLEIGGLVDLNLSLRGTASKPLINGNINMRQGYFNDFKYDSLKGSINYAREQFEGDLSLRTEQLDSIKISGNTSLSYSLPADLEPFSRNTPFSLNIRSEKLPLSLLRVSDIPIKEVQGQGSVDVTAKGTLNEPEIKGQVLVKEGNINIPKYGMKYQDIGMDISLDNNILSLNKFQLKRDKRYFRSRGQIDFSAPITSGELEKIDFSFNTRKFFIARHDDYEIQISGNGNLQGTPNQANFGGKLNIDQSNINLQAFMGAQDKQNLSRTSSDPLLVRASEATKSTSTTIDTIENEDKKEKSRLNENIREMYRNLKGNYTVSIPRNTWIKNSNMRTELSGELNLVKEVDKLAIFGEINLLRGYYDFVGRRFKIKEGKLSFQGGEKINPRVNMTTTYTFRTPAKEKKTLQLIISGNVLQPQIQFSIDGENIGEGDAMAYLIFGRSLAGLSPGQKQGLQESGNTQGGLAKQLVANLVSAQLSRVLGNTLDLDYIEIKSDDEWQSGSIVLGKYITNDLFVSYEKSLSTSQGDNTLEDIVRMEYQLTKIIFLQLIGHQKYSGIDIIFRHEWE